MNEAPILPFFEMSQLSPLPVSDALSRVLGQVTPLPPRDEDLFSALGLVLAEDVASDLDMPPYTKALMDGYALRAADVTEGKGTLTVLEEVTAGRTPTLPVGPGQATRIMTGAPVPAGADAVVQVERTRLEGGQVHIESPAVRPGQNILPRASEMKEGDVVLTRGTLLRPVELGLLATVGRGCVRACPAPQVAILSTGDEVVEPNEKPGPGQIRNSNGTLLSALAQRAGGRPSYLGIARDTLDSLAPLIRDGLGADVLILSGGVSAGKLDLVPGALEQAGVTAHFHKVDLKPGRPLLFGTRARPPLPPTLVFGLPGNPVSALVCFELFIRPALRGLAGHNDDPAAPLQAALAVDFPYRTDRPTYHPARLDLVPEGWQVRPVPWLGSPDLRALARANALVLLPVGDHQHRAGQPLTVFPLPS